VAKPRTRLVSRIARVIQGDLLEKPDLWGVDARFWARQYTWSRACPLTAEEEALLTALVDHYMVEVNLPRRPWCPRPDCAGRPDIRAAFGLDDE
jgi:hypothetical protein